MCRSASRRRRSARLRSPMSRAIFEASTTVPSSFLTGDTVSDTSIPLPFFATRVVSSARIARRAGAVPGPELPRHRSGGTTVMIGSPMSPQARNQRLACAGIQEVATIEGLLTMRHQKIQCSLRPSTRGLRAPLLGDAAEDQDHAEKAAVRQTYRRGAVVDRDLGPSRQENGVVCQADDRSSLDDSRNRIHYRCSIRSLMHGRPPAAPSVGRFIGPTCQLLRN